MSHQQQLEVYTLNACRLDTRWATKSPLHTYQYTSHWKQTKHNFHLMTIVDSSDYVTKAMDVLFSGCVFKHLCWCWAALAILIHFTLTCLFSKIPGKLRTQWEIQKMMSFKPFLRPRFQCVAAIWAYLCPFILDDLRHFGFNLDLKLPAHCGCIF